MAYQPIINNSCVIIPFDYGNQYAAKISYYFRTSVPESNSKFPVKPVDMWRVVDWVHPDSGGKESKFLLFPRHCAQQLRELGILPVYRFMVRDIPLLEKCVAPNYIESFNLYPVQEEIVKHVFDKYLTSENVKFGKGSLVVQLETGGGKTFVAIGLIEKLQERHSRSLRVLWIVLNGLLRDQAIRDLRVAYGDNISICTDKVSPKFLTANVCILIVNTASKMPSSQFKGFGITIYDEVPNYVTDSRMAIFWNTKSVYSVGLTAEPNSRLDGRDAIFKAHLGPVVYGDEISVGETIKFNVSYCFEKYFTPPDYREPVLIGDTELRAFLPTIKKCLCLDSARNDRLIRLILKHRKSGKHIIAMSHHREHILELAPLLQKELRTHKEFAKSSAYRMMSGDGSGKEIPLGSSVTSGVDLIEFPMIYLATYAYASFGLSLNYLNCLILCTPPHGIRKRQIVGRIIRPNKEQPEKNNIPRTIAYLYDSMYYLKNHWDNFERYMKFREWAKEL